LADNISIRQQGETKTTTKKKKKKVAVELMLEISQTCVNWSKKDFVGAHISPSQRHHPKGKKK
jgi:hypothetical protein